MKVSAMGFVMLVVVLAAPVHAQRAIPDDNLSYPVLIASGESATGSGFFVNTATATYLVTARHVLYDRDTRARRSVVRITAYGRDPKDSTKFIADVDLAALDRVGDFAEDETHDIAVARIGSATAPAEPGQVWTIVMRPGITVKSAATSGFVGVGMDTIKRFDDVLVSNPVLIFGYPRSIGVQNIPQFDPERPLLRSGIVAGKNDVRRAIIIDCPSYPGNSGGPVVQIQDKGLSRRLSVIGVVLQFVPVVETWENKMLRYTNFSVTNSGYTVVAPMDAVLTLVERWGKQP